MSTGILSLLTTLIWLASIQEFLKPDNSQSNRKIVIFMSAGTVLTLVLTVSLFQSLHS